MGCSPAALNGPHTETLVASGTMAGRRESGKAQRAPRPGGITRGPAGRRSGLLQTPAGEPIPIVHLAAECWPWARTGGLGEAVASLATYQALAGLPTGDH